MASIPELKRQIALKQQLRDEEKTNADLRKQYHQEAIALEKQLENQQKRNADRRKARQIEAALAEKKVTQELKDQASARKISVGIDKEIASNAKQIQKANEGILGLLLKGNIAGILQKKSSHAIVTEKSRELQARKNIATEILNSSDMEAVTKKESLQLQQDIEGGLVEQEEIQGRLNDITGLSAEHNKKFLEAYIKQITARKRLGVAEKAAEEMQEEINKQLGKAVVLFGSITAVATKFAAKIDAIGKTFGSLTVMGEPFKNDLLDASVEATKLGGGIDDVASITNTLASNFGMNANEAAKLSSKVFDTSKALGLSTDEAANLFGVLTQTANLSTDQAEKLAEGAFQLAKQAGVAPNAVMKDIASSSEIIALFTKDGGNNIADAAVQARQLGMTLQDTAKIAEGLLNFEDSITKEVEASVLIGRQLNLQKARELALNNDIAGAMKAVVSELGSEEEFNNLNLIQRKALADSIGVSVEQLSKMVGESDKLNKSGAMAGQSFRDLLGEEGIERLTQLINKFNALGASLVNNLAPALTAIASGLLPMVEIFGKLITVLQNTGLLLPIVGAALAVYAGKAYMAAKASIVDAMAKMTSKGALLPFPLNAIAIGAGAGVILSAVARAKAVQVDDFHSSPGGITHMSGPAGSFELNPRDSVLATTNPIRVNDVISAPAGGVRVNTGGNTGGERKVRFEISQNTIQGVLATNQDANGYPDFDQLVVTG